MAVVNSPVRAPAGSNHLQNSPSVVAIVLNWNQAEDTCECLNSLSRVDYPALRIIVIDNGSVDGSPEVIKSRFPDITVLRLSENQGFVGGNNAGIDAALRTGPDYVLVLNNDTIVDPAMIGKLVEVAESDHEIAVAGPQMFYYDRPDCVWFLGADIEWPEGRLRFWKGRDRRLTSSEPELPSDYIAGAGMLIRASVLRGLGSFDPYFFIYWEDVELCVRFARAGYKITAVRDAHLWHKVSQSATAGRISRFLLARNHLYFSRKYAGRRAFWLRTLPRTLALRLRVFVRDGFNPEHLVELRGMLSYLRGRSGRQGVRWSDAR